MSSDREEYANGGSSSEQEEVTLSMSTRCLDGSLVPNSFVNTIDSLSHTGAGCMPWAYFIVGVAAELKHCL